MIKIKSLMITKMIVLTTARETENEEQKRNKRETNQVGEGISMGLLHIHSVIMIIDCVILDDYDIDWSRPR